MCLTFIHTLSPARTGPGLFSPGMFTKTCRTILPKTLYEPKNKKDIQQAFVEQFQIEPSSELLDKTLGVLRDLGKIKENNGLWQVL